MSMETSKKQFTVHSPQKIQGGGLSAANCQLPTANSQRGFTLLLAALVASIVLALGAAIFSIAQKQLTLSAIGRDSQFAFYAADTAAECVLYWDFRHRYFGTSTPANFDVETLKCDEECLYSSGGVCSDVPGHSASYPYTMTTQQMDLFADVTGGPFCAQVSVEKSIDPDSGSVRTVIHADGYSTNCTAILTSSRALQRSVELHY